MQYGYQTGFKMYYSVVFNTNLKKGIESNVDESQRNSVILWRLSSVMFSKVAIISYKIF